MIRLCVFAMLGVILVGCGRREISPKDKEQDQVLVKATTILSRMDAEGKAIDTRQNQLLTLHQNGLSNIDGRLNGLEQRMTSAEQSITSANGTLSTVQGDLASLSGTVTHHGDVLKVVRLEDLYQAGSQVYSSAEVDGLVDPLQQDVSQLRRQVKKVGNSVDAQGKRIGEVAAEFTAAAWLPYKLSWGSREKLVECIPYRGVQVGNAQWFRIVYVGPDYDPKYKIEAKVRTCLSPERWDWVEVTCKGDHFYYPGMSTTLGQYQATMIKHDCRGFPEFHEEEFVENLRYSREKEDEEIHQALLLLARQVKAQGYPCMQVVLDEEPLPAGYCTTPTPVMCGGTQYNCYYPTGGARRAGPILRIMTWGKPRLQSWIESRGRVYY